MLDSISDAPPGVASWQNAPCSANGPRAVRPIPAIPPDPARRRLERAARRLTQGRTGRLKRTMDIACALCGILLFGAPMLLIALAIRIDSRGPILFRQHRTGLGGRRFRILKFRTMRHHLSDRAGATQARRGDRRVTRIGAYLRQTSLDELPQLFNVLRGEMAIVGPRPHALGTRAAGLPFLDAAPLYAARHLVRPGLTGLAQVRGWRGETDTVEKLRGRVESDLEYIRRWSVWLDLAILLRTGLAVVRMENAH